MPVIMAFPDPSRAYVRVEVDWADTPSVTYARVLRVDVESGECTPLRPYVCFFGDYLLLSCGRGIWWDTEAPLDRQVYYITEGLGAPCEDPETTIYDTFTRISTNGWGSPTSGPPWAHLGTIGDFLVNGNNGVHSHTATNTGRISTLDIGSPNGDLYGDFAIPQLATGVALVSYLVGRFTDTNNYLMARIGWTTGNTVTLTLRKRVAGVETNLVSITIADLTATINTYYRVRFAYSGTSLRAKLWAAGAAEPEFWQVTATDGDLTTGNGAGFRSVLDLGSLVTLPIQFAFDNFLVGNCDPCIPITADTSLDPMTVPSNGAFRLRNPTHPCRDIYVPLCFDQVASPECLPGSGTFFASMDTEEYDSNSIVLNPVNAKYPLAVARTRRGLSSVLTLVTRTFDDREALLYANEPGVPLQLVGPPQYGIKDTYMTVGDISIQRGLSDHRKPVRINNLPFIQVARPAGPSNGVCGSRVEDMCDIYSTWDEIEAAGLTWEDFIRGLASNDSGPGPGAGRTWDEVQAEFADWDAVEAGGRTWQQLADGD